MADRYSMAHLNNNKEVKYSECSDKSAARKLARESCYDPRARAHDKEKVVVSGSRIVVAM